ncbi:DNA-directed RNA polymerase subunit A' [Candidatus Woesearchaeota archaeon]|nr:DNA-directed RNA polymerase subunit A' [Candidatus Woesearchaeota archaeon]MBT4206786.1 DNA-directed RNA polymerase subunit A' [Candidatus Woesearchaeota archaeon]MBT6761076.1 DNA-directed RNA polymerase subunit A' [Candidatus Woesearchaeota archaeon]MBT6941092.1 DNA-directed RNA polymerase subunit A' [Candidatus Woesearchaeota archaeon]MBT7786559.1 DNA-directed RNA polymerase subunit A' [Candidatus Woesearchaeota archaeon]
MAEKIYKKIDEIDFSMQSPDFIKETSSAKIVTAELYEREGYPVDGGLMDVRLGVIDPGLRCKTCGGKLKECMGHFGHIELARPVIHINYAVHAYNAMRSTCNECYRVKLNQVKLDGYAEKIKFAQKLGDYDRVRKLSKEVLTKSRLIKKCPHCKAKQDAVKIEKPTTYNQGEHRVNPIQVRERLEKISNEDTILLGFNPKTSRPEWMVMSILPIPPVTMRPSITLESGERSEDDLTHKLGDIVRINQRLFENINAGAPEMIIEDLWDLLQYHITTYLDNSVSSVPPARHRSGQALKTLTERIKSKEGRFRNNLAGKRVNYAARTVISPDPCIGFNDVGIPESVARELTIPERVTEWNKEWLLKLIKNGPTNYPGANYVIWPDGKKKKITEETIEQILEELQHGFKVERHLINGDQALFNRQPSLHRMSLMCHRVKVLPGRSFRMNPSVCNPYNADFDGDEMNLHVPQTEEARAEAEVLMEVQTQLITPKNGYNIIGCVEDSITGCYLLTHTKEMGKIEAIDLLTSIGIDNVKFSKEKVSGAEVFSTVLPDDFNFIRKNKHGETTVRVKNGNLEHGIIDKNTIGENNGELIREFYRKYGQDRTIKLLGNIFQLGIQILLKKGFSTGVADTDIPKEAVKKIDNKVHKAYGKLEEHIEAFKKRKIEVLPGKTELETLEIRAMEILNKTRTEIGDYITELVGEGNPTLTMAQSGAKGNVLNFTQMTGCIGQQALGGKRITRGYRGRTLSSFKKGDLGPEARGFVKNTFKRGITPTEFFFHAMTGRDSLMDTALRTPKSGYLYRRLANALQDLKIEYDRTVRNATKDIIQFQYGDDSIDVSKSEGGTINVVNAIHDVLGENV